MNKTIILAAAAVLAFLIADSMQNDQTWLTLLACRRHRDGRGAPLDHGMDDHRRSGRAAAKGRLEASEQAPCPAGH
jgi:hypothetical protein